MIASRLNELDGDAVAEWLLFLFDLFPCYLILFLFAIATSIATLEAGRTHPVPGVVGGRHGV